MSEPQKFRLGAIRGLTGDTRCGYGLDDQPECSDAAAFHVLWLETVHLSNACEQHLAFIVATADVPYEVHVFEANCGMPGALWHHPYEDEEDGYCFFPGPDDLSALEAVDEPVSVMTARPVTATKPGGPHE